MWERMMSRLQMLPIHSIQCHLVPPVWAPEVSCLPSPDVRGQGKLFQPCSFQLLLTLPFLSPFWQTDGEGDLVSEADAWSVYQASSSAEGEEWIGA